MNKKYSYVLKGLDCAHCAAKIERELSKNLEYENVSVNFSNSKLTFNSKSKISKNKLEPELQKIEPDITIVEGIKEIFDIDKFNLVRVVLGITLGLSSMLVDSYKLYFLIIASMLLLYKAIVKAFKVLLKKRIDENILITISVIGAFFINEPFEGFMVIALYEIGKFLEELAVNKSRKSVKELMDIKPEYANLIFRGNVKRVDPSEVKIKDRIRVLVGEKVPVDGTIVKGEGYFDTSILTGESLPVLKKLGDTVLSGSVNLDNILEIEVSEIYENSTVNRILELVENASDKKAKTETFVSKAAGIYTILIIAFALFVWLAFPFLFSISPKAAIYRALSFLVISCPCAIAISVPLSYFSGIGLASKKGILVKGSNFLDNLRKISVLVLDKTGTITTGRFNVSNIVSYNKKFSEKELLKICAHGESLSNHPIARAIEAKYEFEINDEALSDYKEVAGKGIIFKYNDLNVEICKDVSKDAEQTIVKIIINKEKVGIIELQDEIKKSTFDAIKSLKKTKMDIRIFTGDNKKSALKVSEELRLKNIFYDMLPEDKYNELETLIKNKNKNDIVAYAGDGINDAPALALADIGISMGWKGSSSAIEASDVVLMTDNLNKISEGIKISKITSKIIKQNLIFALIIKLLFITLNFLGISTLAWAVFADVGVTIITILNSIRILKY